MQQTSNNNSLVQAELTAPIKSILSCVDSLEANFEQRLLAIKQEHQHDIEEIMNCYADEKHRFLNTTRELEYKIEVLQAQADEAKRLFQTEHIEHKFTKDNMEALRKEITDLTAILKSEQELISLTEKRIKAANVQLESIAAQEPISRTRQFFMKLFEAQPPKSKVVIEETPDIEIEPKQSGEFSY